MLRALGLKKSHESLNDADRSQRVVAQYQDFEIALKAMDYLLDDRTPLGMQLLAEQPNKAIIKLAAGVMQFIEATLGFEAETMARAHEMLNEAESVCWKSKLENESLQLETSSYPPGTEYSVTYAEATLLNALLMLLSENGVIESAKALYKLRRAYQTLDDLVKKISHSSKPASASTASLVSSSSENTPTGKFEKIHRMKMQRLQGSHIGNTPSTTRLDKTLHSKLKMSDVSTIDEFIHSGVNLCFGILQVVLSLIPPTIGKVLSIVGFKGSRESGLKMLWKASDERNIHGSIALLALLIFYDGPFQFTDVDFDLSAVDETQDQDTLSRQFSEKVNIEKRALMGQGHTLNHPGERLSEKLLITRAHFPNNALWLLQESRMHASRGNLEKAVDLMDSFDQKIEMKQVEALLIFDRAIFLCFLHRYERAASEFMTLISKNSWSHGLYYYFAGACYLESWRMCETGLFVKGGRDNIDPTKKNWYKQQAEIYLKKAPTLVGKSRFMSSKQLPFDKFLLRKVSHIKKVQNSCKKPFVECCGTSLIHELCYFYNGYNKMSPEHLELSFKLLGFTGAPNTPHALEGFAAIPESKDEQMIRLLLQSIILRRQGDFKQGREIIDKYIIPRIVSDGGKGQVKVAKQTDDAWLFPIALYERALFTWKEKGLGGLEEVHRWLLSSAQYNCEDYELSTRVSMKTKAALDRLEEYHFD